MRLKTREDVNRYINTQDASIFAIGLTAFNKSYFTNREIEAFNIVALKRSKESSLIDSTTTTYYVSDDPLQKNLISQTSNDVIQQLRVQEYINKGNKKKYILPYKTRPLIQSIAEKNGWHLMSNKIELTDNLLEDKIKFRQLLDKKSDTPGFLTIRTDNSVENYKTIRSKLGNKRFVIQIPFSSGGKGTWIVNSLETYELAIKNAKLQIKDRNINSDEIIISEFIEGLTCSIAAVATKWGTFVSTPVIQLVDIAETNSTLRGQGVFNGHDWSKSKALFNHAHLASIRKSVMRLGGKIYNLGYRGFFGLDLIYTSSGFIIIECNPRLTGVQPTLDMLQERSSLISPIQLHIIEWLQQSEEIHIESENIQQQIFTSHEGSQLILYSPESRIHNIDINLEPGIYTFINNSLNFIRKGYRVSDILEEHEFVITEMSRKHSLMNTHSLMCRLLFNTSITKDGNNITDHAKDIVQAIYQNTTIIIR